MGKITKQKAATAAFWGGTIEKTYLYNRCNALAQTCPSGDNINRLKDRDKERTEK